MISCHDFTGAAGAAVVEQDEVFHKVEKTVLGQHPVKQGFGGVALKRIDKNTIEETDKLNGKVVSVTRLTVAADGRSMSVSVKDLQDGSTNESTLQKQ